MGGASTRYSPYYVGLKTSRAMGQISSKLIESAVHSKGHVTDMALHMLSGPYKDDPLGSLQQVMG